MKALLALFSLALVACGGNTDDTSSTGTGGSSSGGNGGSGGSGGANPGGGTNPGGGGASSGCGSGGFSRLGIRIEFPEPLQCSFTLAEAAAGISIDYDVVVEADVNDVISQQQVSCHGVGAHNLHVFETLSGGNESYCICDTGLCPEPPVEVVTVGAGTYPDSFEWDGKNWAGPSDTGNPKGPPFPPGEYVLRVSTIGEQAGQPFEVYSELTITLTP